MLPCNWRIAPHYSSVRKCCYTAYWSWKRDPTRLFVPSLDRRGIGDLCPPRSSNTAAHPRLVLFSEFVYVYSIAPLTGVVWGRSRVLVRGVVLGARVSCIEHVRLWD